MMRVMCEREGREKGRARGDRGIEGVRRCMYVAVFIGEGQGILGSPTLVIGVSYL